MLLPRVGARRVDGPHRGLRGQSDRTLRGLHIQWSRISARTPTSSCIDLRSKLSARAARQPTTTRSHAPIRAAAWREDREPPRRPCSRSHGTTRSTDARQRRDRCIAPSKQSSRCPGSTRLVVVSSRLVLGDKRSLPPRRPSFIAFQGGRDRRVGPNAPFPRHPGPEADAREGASQQQAGQPPRVQVGSLSARGAVPTLTPTRSPPGTKR
jgi:hypothetical protein